MCAQISTKESVNLLHSGMCMCRKQSLLVIWEILHDEFQQKGWEPKKEETERRERSEASDGEILKDSSKCVGKEWFHYMQRECFL